MMTRLGWPAALFGLLLLVFAVVALSGPGRIDIVDGQTRYEVARSLVDHGDSVIRDKDVWFAVLPGRDGQPHTNYRFPQSGLGAAGADLRAVVPRPGIQCPGEPGLGDRGHLLHAELVLRHQHLRRYAG